MAKKKARYEIKPTKDGEFHFVLIAPNGKVLAQSETYTSKQNANKGIESIRKYAETLTVIDKT